jgi:membrane-associated phospholipid phosphatase
MPNPLASLARLTKLLRTRPMMPRVLNGFLRGLVLVGAGLLALPGVASAEEALESGEQPRPRGAPLVWNAAWPKFGTAEWLSTGAGFAALLVATVGPQPKTHWEGGILFDESVRNALRVSDFNGRRWARDMSDIGLTLSESWPFLDALVVSGWYRQSPEVAVQQSLITLEVIGVTAGLQGIVSSLASRERPYGRDCGGALDGRERDCLQSSRYKSFYSGHSSQAFAVAAVNCMHHAYLPLYGGGTPDTLACIGALGVAGATAFLRVSADVHYTTDVLAGAFMGSAVGLLVPWAFHYRFGPPAPPDEARSWTLQVVPTGLGAYGVLTF